MEPDIKTEKNLQIGVLYDYYNKLLTEKQSEAFYMYYSLDYSLAEIAENMGITRQGALGFIKKAEKRLAEIEKVIGFREKSERTAAGIDRALDLIKNGRIDKAVRELEKIKE